MSLLDTISKDIMAAMKARENDKLEALRAVKAALLLAGTESGAGGKISEEEELKILKKLVKQRKESAEIYKEKGRQDLYDDEVKQAAVIEQYLPEQLSEEKIREDVKKIIADTGASEIKDMGRVMGMAAKHFAGKADNSLVSKIVREELA
ncbi:MAG: glutamyl-tRNA amidotransferase [Marinilabiliales bacterium]|nr:MAG: glutamyl-tRNA amidotransferase [Marinilabiliales bacterium]